MLDSLKLLIGNASLMIKSLFILLKHFVLKISLKEMELNLQS
jgi:hypothetical protein